MQGKHETRDQMRLHFSTGLPTPSTSHLSSASSAPQAVPTQAFCSYTHGRLYIRHRTACTHIAAVSIHITGRFRRTSHHPTLYRIPTSAGFHHGGRTQDHHCPLLCTLGTRFKMGIILIVRPGSSHRLPPCHSLRSTFPQLPHLARGRNLRTCALSELDMFEMRQPR